jgi:type I restriction enzyme S subunit
MVPYLRAANVKDGRLDLSSVLEMNFAPSEQLVYGLWNGDVLVTEGCGSPAELGASARWQNDLPGAVCFQNTLLRLRARPGKSDPGYLYHLARWCQASGAWLTASSGTSILHIGHTRAQKVPVPTPRLPAQRKIAAILSAYDDLIENNNRRIRVLEEMAKRIYGEWFVDFRYPGHEGVSLVDSELGPIPDGWEIRKIGDVASKERYGVTSGPFGSKLGTKDYLALGVPVIRGANLATGGGFRDSDYVFVSHEKADELPSCQARRQDIVVTQRGTLGQVGMIPASARFERYVISQSQMKITVDPEEGESQYLYAALRSPEVTARLLGRAMTAGVPHINLSILREFQIVWPGSGLQSSFAAAVRPGARAVEILTLASENLRATRNLLLPRLISGEIAVEYLDIPTPDLAA